MFVSIKAIALNNFGIAIRMHDVLRININIYTEMLSILSNVTTECYLFCMRRTNKILLQKLYLFAVENIIRLGVSQLFIEGV